MASVGKRVSELTTPAFVLDRVKVEANCSNMLKTCAALGLTLRAQTKTHKTVEGTVLQTGGSKHGLVTSTLQEAEFYTDHGFDDILFGHPFIPHHLPRVHTLTGRLEKFHIIVDSRLAVDTLRSAPPPPGKAWSVFIKVDCGNKRAGVWWEDKSGMELAKTIHDTPNITLAGVYVHCGNSYSAPTPDDVEEVRDQTIDRLLSWVESVRAMGVQLPIVGIGSTPCCSKPHTNMNQLNELHPGNYIFYDMQQVTLGSVKQEDISCCVVTRVIGHYPHRKQLLIDCGFTGLTRQGMGQLPTGCCVFRGHPNLKLSASTQEIGFVESVEGQQLDFNQYPIGSLLYILPWHSCATAALYPLYHVVDGDDMVIEEWIPTRGW